METKVKTTPKRWWLKYSPDFKRSVVDRFLSGESATALSRELKIRRKFVYQWRDLGFGSGAAAQYVLQPQPQVSDDDILQRQIETQQQRIAELERLLGRQSAELDFFAAALRAAKDLRHKGDESSGTGSTRRSRT